jgi:hypothetical protein
MFEPDKFLYGDYVRVKASQQILTGTIAGPKDHKGRYWVKLDSSFNDTSILEDGLWCEDELERCDPPQRN